MASTHSESAWKAVYFTNSLDDPMHEILPLGKDAKEKAYIQTTSVYFASYHCYYTEYLVSAFVAGPEGH